MRIIHRATNAMKQAYENRASPSSYPKLFTRKILVKHRAHKNMVVTTVMAIIAAIAGGSRVWSRYSAVTPSGTRPSAIAFAT